VAWGFGSSEDEVAPKGVAQTRPRQSGGRGVVRIRDGRPVDRQAVRRTDRDAPPTGKRGRPPRAPTPGVGWIQAVQRRRRGRFVRVEVHRVLMERRVARSVECADTQDPRLCEEGGDLGGAGDPLLV